MDNKLYHRIRTIRIKHGYKTLQSFADALHVSIANVKTWEREKRPVLPRLDTLLDMCDLFNCDLDYLVGRIEEPTHDIKFIHEKTGLSVEAIQKLISLKDSGMEDLISDIVEHKNADRLLRLLLLASDEDEIAWLDLDSIPRELLSSYADKPMDFSVGIGSDVSDFLASQEMVNIIRSIRESREKEKSAKQEDNRHHHWREVLEPKYNVHHEKMILRKMLERLEDDCMDLSVDITQISDPERIEKGEKILDRLSTFYTRIRKASFAEWKRGTIQKEYKEIYGEE